MSMGKNFSSEHHSDLRPRTHTYLLGLGFLIGFLWPLYRLIYSTGWILDDEISHFLFSQAVTHWPEILLDEWARPGRNLIHSIIAPFGLTATRIYTLILSTVAVFISYRVALLLNIRHAWTIPFLLCFQPWYPELSYPVLTQAPFMLVWILAIYLALLNRLHLAAFAFGYLSLIRYEGIFITALWGLWIVFQQGGFVHGLIIKQKLPQIRSSLKQNLFLGLSTILPILFLNFCAYFIQGRVPFNIYFDHNPTDIYGSGSLFHYFPMIPSSVGELTLCLSAIGLFFILIKKLNHWTLILFTYSAYFVLHSVIYWKGSFASGGYYHFLMPMAPLFALLAAVTINKILTSGLRYKHYLTAAIITFICYQGLNMASYQHSNQDWSRIMAGKASVQKSLLAPTNRSSKLAKQIQEASEHVNSSTHQSENRITHCAHVYFYHLTDQPDTKSFREERLAPLSTFPIGSHYIWEYNYADLEPRTSRSELEQNPNWKQIKTWKNEGGEDSVILYQKKSNLPYKENLSPKGKNLSY